MARHPSGIFTEADVAQMRNPVGRATYKEAVQMFAAPREAILKDFMEFSDTGFADQEQSPPHQRTHAAEHYAKLIDRIRDDTEGSDMRAVYRSPPGASMLERLVAQTFEVASRFGCGVFWAKPSTQKAARA